MDAIQIQVKRTQEKSICLKWEAKRGEVSCFGSTKAKAIADLLETEAFMRICKDAGERKTFGIKS